MQATPVKPNFARRIDKQTTYKFTGRMIAERRDYKSRRVFGIIFYLVDGNSGGKRSSSISNRCLSENPESKNGQACTHGENILTAVELFIMS